MRHALLVVCLITSAFQSIFFVYALMTDGDGEGVYLYHGQLAVTRQISLYQDEMTVTRVPLPYYLIGLSQVLWGPSLVSGRMVSAAVGLMTIILLWRLATRLGGELCGVLTALFAVTQAYILGHFAWASFHSLVAFLLVAGLYVLLGTNLRFKHFWAMTISTLLFFTRAAMWPLHPLAFFFLLWRTKSRGERWAITVMALGIPLGFFLYDANHWKLLASVPGLSGFVRPFGWETLTVSSEPDWWTAVTRALILFGRSYKAWIVSAVVLLAALAWMAAQGRSVKEYLSHRGIIVIGVVTVYLAAWQMVIYRHSLKSAVGYFASFAILAAVPFGYGFSVLLEGQGATRVRRTVIGAFLVGLFLVSPSISPPPPLPLSVAYDRPPTVALQEVVSALRSLIPPGSRVFLFGAAQAPYLAGLRPYLQPANHLETLSPVADDRIRRKSGLWGEAEIRKWLGYDAGYAVVWLSSLRARREVQYTPSGNNVDLIESLLARHFAQIAVLDQYPGLVLHVYKRTSSANRGS